MSRITSLQMFGHTSDKTSINKLRVITRVGTNKTLQVTAEAARIGRSFPNATVRLSGSACTPAACPVPVGCLLTAAGRACHTRGHMIIARCAQLTVEARECLVGEELVANGTQCESCGVGGTGFV